MRRTGWMVLISGVLLAGCAGALPSAAQYPAPLPSAAQPALGPKGDSAYSKRGAEALREALRGIEPDDALQRIPQEGLQIPSAGVAAACAGAPGNRPVLVCHYGPVSAQPVAQVILWHDYGRWHAQVYPQAAQKIAAERRQALSAWGCQIGCYSGITAARQTADGELVVVVNLGMTGSRRAEEVQVLREDDGQWEVRWVPPDGQWNYGDATVVLPAKGTALFRVRNSSLKRQDQWAGYLAEGTTPELRRFSERWERKGDGFVMRDRVEDPSPYATLVRLIHYLSTGADEKARPMLAEGVDLDETRRELAQKPLRQGWGLVRWGESGFLLDTAKTGRLRLGVRFERKENDWVLAEVWQIKP